AAGRGRAPPGTHRTLPQRRAAGPAPAARVSGRRRRAVAPAAPADGRGPARPSAAGGALRRSGAVVLLADERTGAAGPVRRPRDGVRLHGRAGELPLRPAGHRRPRALPALEGRRGVHRRLPAVPVQVAPPPDRVLPWL